MLSRAFQFHRHCLTLTRAAPWNLLCAADNMVGKGGYGEVYRGVLDDGRAVAVKRLAPTAAADEKKEKDFLTELGTVGHVHHPNVCALLGCCVDRGLHLVFEFSTRGSVSANLHGKSSPLLSLWWRALLRHHCQWWCELTITNRRLEAAGDVVEAAARDRGRHGARAALPPQGLRAPDHPPRHQGVQHPPHRRLRASGVVVSSSSPTLLSSVDAMANSGSLMRSDFGLRPRPVAAVGVDAPRHRAHRGNVRVSQAFLSFFHSSTPFPWTLRVKLGDDADTMGMASRLLICTR